MSTREASSFSPRVFLKVVLCAYFQNIYSGRQAERLLLDSFAERYGI